MMKEKKKRNVESQEQEQGLLCTRKKKRGSVFCKKKCMNCVVKGEKERGEENSEVGGEKTRFFVTCKKQFFSQTDKRKSMVQKLREADAVRSAAARREFVDYEY